MGNADQVAGKMVGKLIDIRRISKATTVRCRRPVTCHRVLVFHALDMTRGEVLKYPYSLQAVQSDQSIDQARGFFSIAGVSSYRLD